MPMNKKVLYSVLVLGLIPLYVGSARADEAPVAHRSLVPIDVSAFYVNPNSPATLRWATNLSVGQALAYQILDYTGRLIKQGNAKIASGDVVAIDINLSQGWYEVRFPESSESFGIVSS